MRETNKMRLEFPSQSVNERFARSAVSGFIAQLDPTVDELNDIKTAVSEAVTNAIVHGYPDEIGRIVMTVKLFEESMVEITVKDYGRGIEDVKKAREPMFTTGGEERSGMGFTIMESFTDNLKVKSKKDRGTTVTMRVKLHRRVHIR